MPATPTWLARLTTTRAGGDGAAPAAARTSSVPAKTWGEDGPQGPRIQLAGRLEFTKCAEKGEITGGESARRYAQHAHGPVLKLETPGFCRIILSTVRHTIGQIR